MINMAPNIFINIQDTIHKKPAITKQICYELINTVSRQDTEITIRIVSTKESQFLNKKFRRKNYPTNVLSFLIDNSEKLLGDLVLCHDVIRNEAKEQKKLIKNHYAHLILHGFLHLIGYDHTSEAEQKIMEKKEIQLLKKFKIANPYILK